MKKAQGNIAQMKYFAYHNSQLDKTRAALSTLRLFPMNDDSGFPGRPIDARNIGVCDPHPGGRPDGHLCLWGLIQQWWDGALGVWTKSSPQGGFVRLFPGVDFFEEDGTSVSREYYVYGTDMWTMSGSQHDCYSCFLDELKLFGRFFISNLAYRYNFELS